MISSIALSRSRATSRGSLRPFRPSNVALITLCGFELPIDFVRIFDTPAACMTARTAPPAMIPVPSWAGFEQSEHLMRNRVVREWNADHVLLGGFNGLADCLWHFLSLAAAMSHMST